MSTAHLQKSARAPIAGAGVQEPNGGRARGVQEGSVRSGQRGPRGNLPHEVPSWNG